MKRYGKYIRPCWYAFILGPLLMLTEVAGEVLLPSFMADIINVGAANHDVGYILQKGMIMILTAFIMMAGGVGGAWFASVAAINFGTGLRKDAFKKIQTFSFSEIDRFSTGSLVTRLTNDITQVQNLIMMALRMMLRAPGMLIGAIIMAFLMDRELAAVFLIVLPVMTVVILLLLRIAYPRFEFMQKKLDALNSNIQEVLTNVRVIKSFVREDYESARFEKSNAELKESSLNAFKIAVAQMPLMMLFMNLTTLVVVWLGGNQILGGKMQVGDLTAFTTYIVQVLMSLMMLAMVFLQSSRAFASGRRINEVMDTKVSLTDDHAAYPEAVVKNGKIEFQNVSFRYYKDSAEKVLDQINLTIEPGQMIGIIGSTGCGKTTLVSMIPRLYDVDEGKVLVDGIDVRDYSLNHLREGVGMVLQKNVLFSGTIEENLQWGDENADKDQIREAAESAQAEGFIQKLADGYDTELGQGGVNVSGGQKQRLCIARALLKRPKILLLDDSTSAVDTATEARIREAFSTTRRETTKLIIAQRIGSVMEADQIIVMDGGKIVGLGKHEALLETCKAYQEIYDSQMKKEVIA